jgi:exopolysaccharide biosynthesis protein
MNRSVKKNLSKKIIVLVSLLLIVILGISGCQYWRYRQQMKQDEVITFAQEYVDKKFGSEVIFDLIYYYFVEEIYFLKFHTLELPNVIFTVYVKPINGSS